MPRGRKVPNPEGAPVARYSNRTDLAAKKAAGTQPVRTPTGQGYGDAKALADAQRAIPLPQGAPPPAPTVPAPAPPGGGVERISGTMTPTAAKGYVPPAYNLSSSASAKPHEPLTAGLSVGPGPGPAPGGGNITTAALLAALASASNDPTMAQLSAIADSQGV